MDPASPRKVPLLPLLGLVLLAEAVPPLTRVLSEAPISFYKGLLLEAALVALLGTAILAVCLIKANRPLPKALVVFSVLVLLDNMMQQQLFPYAAYRSMSISVQSLLSFPAYGLMTVGAPLLWGSALARRENPSDLAAAKLGRIGAGIVQFAFVFVAAQEITGMAMRGVYGVRELSNPSIAVLANLIRIAFRVLILWASIQSVRTAPDDAVVRLRARMIHRLMSWWFALVALNVGFYFMLSRNPSMPNMPSLYMPTFNLWSGGVFLTLTATAANLISLRLRSKSAGYNSEPVPHP